MSLVEDIKTIQRAVGAEPDGIFGPRTAAAVRRELNRQDAKDAKDAKEEISGLDERTRENIATLDKKARERFEQLALLGKATAATFGCDWVMISGHRTWQEQDAIYAEGRTAPGKIRTYARGGESNHNFGIAGDFGVFRGKSYLDETNPLLARRVHEACAVHARKLGFDWGGDWKGKLVDTPHFEISTTLSMAQKRKLYAERGSVL